MPREMRSVPAGAIDQFAQAVIPAGPFLMGRPVEDILADESETPCVSVYLDAFSIDAHPVTRARFQEFIDAGGYTRRELWDPDGWEWRERNGIVAPSHWERPAPAPSQGLLPVNGVSWYEATAFARWCGRTLPTSAQWEKAARGTDGRAFPWGDDPPTPQHVNYGLVVGSPTPVGSHPRGASPYGCHDMAGNVNNWTADWFWTGFYGHLLQGTPERRVNPVCDTDLVRRLGLTVTERTDRGGGFATPVGSLSVIGTTRRLGWRPESREPWQGFRTAAMC